MVWSLILSIVVIGLLAGILGGLAGVGASLTILPALHLVMGNDPPAIHHLYMAAGMVVNIVVAIPATRRHAQAGAVRKDLLMPLLIIASAGMLAGVWTSNFFSGNELKVALAAFIAVYCLWNLLQAVRHEHPHDAGRERIDPPYLAVSAGATGFLAGLLGLGGGVILVPFLQLLCRVPLRQAIATSSAVMCVTAAIGATAKLVTLGEHGQSVVYALKLAALMAPTAVIGALIGAMLTHRLPLKAVRVCVSVLLLIASAKMVGVV